jgi:hypothetical protein
VGIGPFFAFLIIAMIFVAIVLAEFLDRGNRKFFKDFLSL